MKGAALLLAFSVAGSALAEPAPPPAEQDAPSAGPLEPLEVKASRLTDAQVRRLKETRAAGGAVAASGAGLMAYAAAAAATGPVGWAAGMLYAGGVTAYAAHERLRGRDVLKPTRPSPAPALSASRPGAAPWPPLPPAVAEP